MVANIAWLSLIYVARTFLLYEDHVMKDPFAPYARWSNSILRKYGWLVGERLLCLVNFLVIVSFWGVVILAFHIVAPSARTTQWLETNSGWLGVGTGVLWAAYWFCRNFLDTRTGD